MFNEDMPMAKREAPGHLVSPLMNPRLGLLPDSTPRRPLEGFHLFALPFLFCALVGAHICAFCFSAMSRRAKGYLGSCYPFFPLLSFLYNLAFHLHNNQESKHPPDTTKIFFFLKGEVKEGEKDYNPGGEKSK